MLPCKLQVTYGDPVQLVVKGSGHGMLSKLHCMNFLSERILPDNRCLWHHDHLKYVHLSRLNFYTVLRWLMLPASQTVFVCVYLNFSHILNLFQIPVVRTVPGKTALGKGFLFFSGLIGIDIHVGNPTQLPYLPMYNMFLHIIYLPILLNNKL